MFLETKSRETLRFKENKIHCSPQDQSLSDLLYSKGRGQTGGKQIITLLTIDASTCTRQR